MSVLAIGCALVAAVQADAGELPRVRLQAWFAAQHDETVPGDVVERTRARFLRAWPRGAPGDALLRDMGRLRRVFDGCFAYQRPDAPLALDGIELRLPASYDPRQPTPTIVEVRPSLQPSTRYGARAANEQAIVIRVTLGALQALVQTPPLAFLDTLAPAVLRTPAATVAGRLGYDDEAVRRGLFSLLGIAQQRYNIDRDRLIVDVAGGACGPILRAAIAAPDRFAGLVLRAPRGVSDIVLYNLAGLDVLVLRRDRDAAVAALERAFDRVPDARCVFRSLEMSAAEIGSWCASRRRDLMRSHVTLLMPVDDVIDGYWVGEISADVGDTGLDEPARIDVRANRETATITVEARGIERFSLLLNDEIIGLDEFTLVINRVPVAMRRSRSLSLLCDKAFERFDQGFLFTTAVTIDVPRKG